MSTGKERMETLLAHLKMNANEFASSLGYKRTDRIYNILSGRNGISTAVARDIHKHHESISYEWIAKGEGEMLVQQTEEGKEEKVSINIANLTKLAGMPNIVDIPEHLEAPKINSINLVEGFSEKLVKLGYEKPVDEKGYKVIALDLADRLNRMASMSEDMVGIVSKPLLDRIGLVDKQRILAESRVAELEAKIAAMEIKAAK